MSIFFPGGAIPKTTTCRYRFGYRSMPKPLLLTRPSGLYARFLVPADLRQAVGRRFLTRALHARADHARLVAARMGLALSQAFRAVRCGCLMTPDDFDELLKRLSAGPSPLSELHLGTVRLPNGAVLEGVQIDTPADASLFRQTLVDVGGALPAGQPALALSPFPAKPALMLSAAVELFLRQFAQKKRAASNLLDTTHTLRVLVGVVGEKPLREVGAEDMDDFLDAIASWPPNATKKWPGLTVSEVLAKARREGLNGLSHRTQEKHLDRVRVFFGWALERREIERNPAKTLHVLTRAQEDAGARQSFTPDELARAFDPIARSLACDQPHRWWGPMLALYTGARVTELAQLWTDDLEQISGIWGLHIAPRVDRGQQVKNAMSRRFVPVHPALLDAGLIAYRNEVVAAFGTSRLFPGLSQTKPGDTLGDWWNRTYRKTVRVEGVFHAFRHTFASRAERCGLPEPRIGRLTGHSTSGTVLGKHYIDPPTLPERASDIAQLAFEGVPPLVPYQRGQFAVFFESVKRRSKLAVAKSARAERGLREQKKP